MTVVIAWGDTSIEAPSAAEALKVYRGMTERMENIAEDRVRQIVLDEMSGPIPATPENSPWLVKNASITVKPGKVTIAPPVPWVMENGVVKPGWNDWAGGEQPVTDHVLVEYALRDGREFKQGLDAYLINWNHRPDVDGGAHDVIKYRICNHG